MTVVDVVAVFVFVNKHAVFVTMAVGSLHSRIMLVRVVAVVVGVQVLVNQGLVRVPVGVPLRDVQRDAGQQHPRGDREMPARPGRAQQQ
jgi:hypothetical protein